MYMSFQGSFLPIQRKDLSTTYVTVNIFTSLAAVRSATSTSGHRDLKVWGAAVWLLLLMLPCHHITIGADHANPSVNDTFAQCYFIFHRKACQQGQQMWRTDANVTWNEYKLLSLSSWSSSLSHCKQNKLQGNNAQILDNALHVKVWRRSERERICNNTVNGRRLEWVGGKISAWTYLATERFVHFLRTVGVEQLSINNSFFGDTNWMAQTTL